MAHFNFEGCPECGSTNVDVVHQGDALSSDAALAFLLGESKHIAVTVNCTECPYSVSRSVTKG